MKIKYLTLSLLAAAIAVACEDRNWPENGNGDDPANEIPAIYTCRQKKSLKRGVSFNFSSIPDQDCPLLGPACTWSYNWSSSIPSASVEEQFRKYGMEFVQMMWNDNYNPDNFRSYKNSHPDAKYILAFNEPNLTDQAKMTPAEAAGHWPAVKSLAAELGMKIISPAMNYGTLSGYHDPYKWLDEFFSQPGVSLDDVDGIAIHCYMGSTAALKGYVEGFKKYGKPIWLTEFCNWENNSISADSQLKFMVESINYLENDPDVFRYAWFIPRGNGEAQCHNSLLTSISFANKTVELTELGKVFVNMSAFDKTLFYGAGEYIPAEHYIDVNGSVHLQSSTDKEGGILQLNDLVSGTWTEYQVNIPKAGKYTVEVRYSSYRDGALKFVFGDSQEISLDIANSSKEWKTASAEVGLNAGQQSFRVYGNSGAAPSLNWFRISAK